MNLIKVEIIAILLVMFSFSISAQDHLKAEKHHTHHSLNHAAVFNGVTTTTKGGHNYYTLGIDYVRIFQEGGSFGIGAFGEIIFADHKEYALGIPFFIKIAKGLWFRTGPGIEIVKEAKETDYSDVQGDSKDDHHITSIMSSSDPHAELEDKVKFLFRFGVIYNIHLGEHWSISPSVDFDLVDKHNAIVYGINIGYAF